MGETRRKCGKENRGGEVVFTAIVLPPPKELRALYLGAVSTI